jgi:ketose-bisphosphate aldolase
MSIVSSAEIVTKAWKEGYAVAAINCQGGNYDIVRAIMETAAEERAPVILMAYAANTAYYGLGWLPKLVSTLEGDFDIPVAVHLDHGQNVELVKRGTELGYSSVMIDFSTKPLAENIEATKAVLSAAHPKGISVEAELGELLRNEGDVALRAAENLVDPEDVRQFLEQTPVDMLAVGIGNAHGFYKGEPNIRIDLLERVREVAGDTPLVLHGSTGIPEATVKSCIKNGMAKINFGTVVRVKFVEYLKEGLGGAVEHKGHAWRVCQYAEQKIKQEIRGIIRLTGSSGAV